MLSVLYVYLLFINKGKNFIRRTSTSIAYTFTPLWFFSVCSLRQQASAASTLNLWFFWTFSSVSGTLLAATYSATSSSVTVMSVPSADDIWRSRVLWRVARARCYWWWRMTSTRLPCTLGCTESPRAGITTPWRCTRMACWKNVSWREAGDL